MAFKFERLNVWKKAIEVVSCLYLGKKRELIKQNQFNQLYSESEQIIKMLQALRKSLT